MTYILFYFKYKRNNLNVTIRVFFLYIFCVIKLSFAKKKKQYKNDRHTLMDAMNHNP